MKYPKLSLLDNDLYYPDYLNNISNRFSKELTKFFESDKSNIGQIDVDYAEKQTLIFLIIDGLGSELNYSPMFNNSFLLGGEWISSTYPSITPTALSSIFTGLPPSKHGVTGHLLPTFKTKSLKEILLDKNMNWLDYEVSNSNGYFLDSGNLNKISEPNFFIFGPANPLHPSHGIIPVLFGKTLRSYLTKNHLKHHIRRIIKERRSKKVIMIYSMTYDIIAHLIGKQNIFAKKEIRSWSSMLNSLLSSITKNQQKETAIIISADHGHVSVEKEIRMKTEIQDLVLNKVYAVGKSGRVLHFYPKPGNEDKLTSTIGSEWGEFGTIVSEDTIQKLIGPDPEITALNRIGAINFVPYSSYSPIWDTKYNYVNKLLNIPKRYFPTTEHGGLTKNELLTPFFIFHS